jgi:predicted glycogen debranching enzyme
VYGIEQERGLDYREDLFNPFVVSFALGQRTVAAAIIASTRPSDARQARELRRSEIQRRAALLASSPSKDPLVQTLTAASDQFVVKRGELKTIIAGYHWFSDWGRDTMVALPGLTLVTGRSEVARSILSAFANSVDQGMLPNRFPDAGERPEYNTVDATLWFFEAIRAFAKYTADFEFVESLYGTLKDIIDWHLRGTRYGIRVDSDGLLASGEAGVQLTWMDVKIGDWVVTPRYGKPVEIQALWYNALRIMDDFACRFGDSASQIFFHELAARALDSCNRLFWNVEIGCLYDVVNGEVRDASIRPNQVFAVSLLHTMLSREKAKSVIDVVERELLTPLGLRSLSPQDPQYRPRYEGGVRERDSSYHQGTVWPWLMGPFITAYMKVNDRSEQAREQAARWLNGFGEHLQTAGLGQISEIADADPPYRARGCVAQAWSIAELLRCAAEDVYVAAEISALKVA